MTDPPIIADIALLVARRFRAPLVVISQDVFPEIAVELKRLENRAVMGLLRGLVRLYLRRADRIVAIGDTMRRRLEEKGAPPDRLRVIPNWVDTKRLAPHGQGQHLGSRRRSRREVRHHALRQRRPCARSRFARAGLEFPPRP